MSDACRCYFYLILGTEFVLFYEIYSPSYCIRPIWMLSWLLWACLAKDPCYICIEVGWCLIHMLPASEYHIKWICYKNQHPLGLGRCKFFKVMAELFIEEMNINNIGLWVFTKNMSLVLSGSSLGEGPRLLAVSKTQDKSPWHTLRLPAVWGELSRGVNPIRWAALYRQYAV